MVRGRLSKPRIKCEMGQVMGKVFLALIAAWFAISALTFGAQAAPVGSSEWWQQMDREGRGGRG